MRVNCHLCIESFWDRVDCSNVGNVLTITLTRFHNYVEVDVEFYKINWISNGVMRFTSKIFPFATVVLIFSYLTILINDYCIVLLSWLPARRIISDEFKSYSKLKVNSIDMGPSTITRFQFGINWFITWMKIENQMKRILPACPILNRLFIFSFIFLSASENPIKFPIKHIGWWLFEVCEAIS